MTLIMSSKVTLILLYNASLKILQILYEIFFSKMLYFWVFILPIQDFSSILYNPRRM